MDLATALAELTRLPQALRDRIDLCEPPPGARVVGPCWIVAGRLNRNGYVRIWWDGREPVAHRVIWRVLRGAIPARLVLDHLCRCPRCGNPDHLEPVTVRVNTLRGDAVLFQPRAGGWWSE